jgi:NADPH-dependent ferric siderophore reductase
MPFLKAQTTIVFPNVSTYLDTIIDSFSAHNMALHPDGDGHVITSSLGSARMTARQGALDLTVEAPDPVAFNRLKHELTGLIDFVTRPENLEITWTGDAPGAMPPADLRVLTVRHVRQLTPRMRRISFEGNDLARYASPDQIHCRLLFQDKDTTAPQWPQLDDNGRILWPEAGKLASRIFTIRRIDPTAGTLDIDFVLHGGSGPGSSWAAAAEPGDIVGILGPAANGPEPARWVLLAGDETGLPGMARILEALPASAQGIALIEVADAAEEQEIKAPPGIEILWLHRDGASAGTTNLLADALRAVDPPHDPENVFCWIGAEYTAFRDMRTHLRTAIGLPLSRVVAFSHWRRGMSEEDIVKAGITSVLA